MVEITDTSRAAGRPPHQVGRKTSAGRLQDPGIKDGTLIQMYGATESYSGIALDKKCPRIGHPESYYKFD